MSFDPISHSQLMQTNKKIQIIHENTNVAGLKEVIQKIRDEIGSSKTYLENARSVVENYQQNIQDHQKAIDGLSQKLDEHRTNSETLASQEMKILYRFERVAILLSCINAFIVVVNLIVLWKIF